MRAMFYDCSELESVDVSSFDTCNVTNMLHMFIYCSSLTTLDLSNFDTSKVTDARLMFRRCSGLKDLKLADTFTLSESTSTDGMFNECNSNLRIIGNSNREFIEADSNTKNAIKSGNGKVYVTSEISGISESIQTILDQQLHNAELSEEMNAT